MRLAPLVLCACGRLGFSGVAPAGDAADAAADASVDALGPVTLAFHQEHRITNTPGDSRFPVIAYNGSGFGTVWRETEVNNNIYFSGLDPDAAALTQTTIVSAQNGQDNPAMLWTGTDFAVLWRDGRASTYQMWFMRVSNSGVAVAPEVQVTSGSGHSASTMFAHNGTEYGTARVDLSSGIEVKFRRVDASGNPIGGDTVIGTTTFEFDRASIVYTGSGYGIAWVRAGTTPSIYLTRLDANGTKLGADTLVSTGSDRAGGPVVAWTGSEYGVAWDQCPATSCSPSTEIWFARVAASGARIGTPRTLSSTAGQASDPDIVWSGGSYWIVWEAGDVSVTRLDAAGATVIPPQRATTVTAGAQSPKVVATSTGLAIVWEDVRNGNGEVYARTITFQ